MSVLCLEYSFTDYSMKILIVDLPGKAFLVFLKERDG